MRDIFRSCLLEWYAREQRDLPWRHTRDPYAIWVSEIMLQQTRVGAVIPFYEQFLERFPTIGKLAEADEHELLAAWAGLGYYSRVRNMQRAAQAMKGRFPDTYDAIRELAGVGEYTAAAVASIAFGLPHAAVDGNVLRVLSRVFNDDGNIGSAPVRRRLGAAAQELLDPRRAGEFNQAMMELGATVCLPRQPECPACPVAALCEARSAGTQNKLPVTRKRPEMLRLARKVFIAEHDGSVLLWQRGSDSKKLAGFWELPELEVLEGKPATDTIGSFRHSITNHDYTFEVAVVRAGMSARCKQVVNCAWIARNALGNMALSTTARKALALYSRIDHPRAGIE